METVHGQKLGSLLGELLQPFDLGRELQALLVLCKKLWVVLVLHIKLISVNNDFNLVSTFKKK